MKERMQATYNNARNQECKEANNPKGRKEAGRKQPIKKANHNNASQKANNRGSKRKEFLQQRREEGRQPNCNNLNRQEYVKQASILQESVQLRKQDRLQSNCKMLGIKNLG